MTIVRAVCQLAARLTCFDPLATTEAAYDAALPGSPYPESPRAFQIARQLRAPWPRVVDVAHKQGRDFRQSVAAFARREDTPFTLEQAGEALEAIAIRLGANTLRPAAYDEELDRLIEEQRRAWLHGRQVADAYPSAMRIDAVYGWDAALAAAGLEPRPETVAQSAELFERRHPRGTWTCERCVESLITSLDEHARAAPGELLSQRAYRKRETGRSDLAQASAVTVASREMGTTFSSLRAELVAWRLGAQDREPACLELARATDQRLAAEAATVKPFAAAHQARRERTQRWEAELLAALVEIGHPAARAEIAEKLAWPPAKTGRRLEALAGRGRVVMTNIGRGNKTARWTAG